MRRRRATGGATAAVAAVEAGAIVGVAAPAQLDAGDEPGRDHRATERSPRARRRRVPEELVVARCDRRHDLRGGREASGRVALETAQDRPLPALRELGREGARRRRRRVEPPARIVRRERQLAGDHLEHHRAERIEVARRRQRLAAELLRRHVLGRADGDVGAGVAGVLRQGEAEVGDDGAHAAGAVTGAQAERCCT